MNEEMTSTETNTEISPVGVDNSEASEATAETGQETSQPATQEDWDYTKDARWQKMWKGDVKNMYKSYKNLEQVYEPIKSIKSDYDNLQNVFKQYGIDSAKLPDYISEYNQFKDPKNPRNMMADYFGQYLESNETRPLMENFFTFLEKPEYLPHLNNFLNELVTTENQRLYPGWNSQQIAEHKTMQKELSEFKKMFDEQKAQERKVAIDKEVNAQIQKVSEFAKENGINLDENTFAQIGQYLRENGLNEKHIMLAFKEMFAQQLEETKTKRLEESLLKRLNKNNNKVVPRATTKIQSEALDKNMTKENKIKYFLNQFRGAS